MTPTRGLVIGKFYPPHRGHQLLIDAAQSHVDEVHVIVCDRPGEDPPAALRADWLRELHPKARVTVVEDRYDPEDSALWAGLCRGWLGFTPDAVFTSEDYGPRFAACLGCRHVQVDRARTAVPVSGTRVRADPLGCWDYLAPPVRAYYGKRVVLVGAESTGKTTLAAALAAALGTEWVAEYGREYAERKAAAGEAWTSDDFTAIAREQYTREDAAARRANKVLVCDTDAFATAVWHRRYLGHRSAAVEAIAAAHRRADLYLLADVATPFVQDGTRDGEHVREWMHRTFVEELTATGRPFVEVSGSHDDRLRAAVEAVVRLITPGNAFRTNVG